MGEYGHEGRVLSRWIGENLCCRFLLASMETNPRERLVHNFFRWAQQRQCRIIFLDPEPAQIDWEKIQAETHDTEDCARQNLENTADKKESLFHHRADEQASGLRAARVPGAP